VFLKIMVKKMKNSDFSGQQLGVMLALYISYAFSSTCRTFLISRQTPSQASKNRTVDSVQNAALTRICNAVLDEGSPAVPICYCDVPSE